MCRTTDATATRLGSTAARAMAPIADSVLRVPTVEPAPMPGPSAPPKKKKPRALTKTELKRVEIRTLLLTDPPTDMRQIAKQLDCDKRTILNVKRMLEEESQAEKCSAYDNAKRSLIVKDRPGRPRKRTPGLPCKGLNG